MRGEHDLLRIGSAFSFFQDDPVAGRIRQYLICKQQSFSFLHFFSLMF